MLSACVGEFGAVWFGMVVLVVSCCRLGSIWFGVVMRFLLAYYLIMLGAYFG